MSRFYGMLARGGELDGVRVLSPEAIERATRGAGFAAATRCLMGLPMRFGLGFMLSWRVVRFGRSNPQLRPSRHGRLDRLRGSG